MQLAIAIFIILLDRRAAPYFYLTFTFNPASGTSQQAIDGFTAAGALWSAKLTNNVNVNIDINFATLGTNILAQASSTRQNFNYNNVYTALSIGQTSTDDRAPKFSDNDCACY